jgi:hypothetical protein
MNPFKVPVTLRITWHRLATDVLSYRNLWMSLRSCSSISEPTKIAVFATFNIDKEIEIGKDRAVIVV